MSSGHQVVTIWSSFRKFHWWLPVIVIALAFPRLAAAQSPADQQNVLALFPDTKRVAADFPGDAESFAALNVLYRAAFNIKGPGAYNKCSTYQLAFAEIDSKYIGMNTNTQAYQDFSNRSFQLLKDANFRRSVLEKYHIPIAVTQPPAQAAQPGRPGLPALSTPTPPPPMRNTDMSDAMIKRAFAKAIPFLIVSILVMLPVASLLVRKTIASPSGQANPTVTVGSIPPFPESLRNVQLPDMSITVEVATGLVIDKETTIHTSVHTSTSGGQVYTVGNEVHSTPIQTHTSVSSTQEDLIWILTPEKQETSWTFTGGEFKARPGHIISEISRRLPNGSKMVLVAYNHITGQWLSYPEINRAIQTSMRNAFLASILIGSVPSAMAVGVVLASDPAFDRHELLNPIFWIAWWVMGLIPTVVFAFFVAARASGKVSSPRYQRLNQHYLPGFRQYLDQCTPHLKKLYGIS